MRSPYRSLLEKLTSVIVYGSVARKTTRKDSDIDLLIIADSLPKGRMKRQELFLEVEKPLEPIISELWNKGFHVDFSPIILSVGDVEN